MLLATVLVYRFPNQLNLVLVRFHESKYLQCEAVLTLLIFLFPADPPRITNHPQEIRDAVPGKPVVFTVRVTGSKPLTYQWQWKPAGEESSDEEWQSCDTGWFPGADSSTLNIPSVQKSNKGSYCCTISNPVGSQTSKPAALSVGKILPPACAVHNT